MSEFIGPLITMLDRVQDLKLLPRTGWLLAGIAVPESVAEHSFGVTMLTLWMAETINADSVAGLPEIDVDRAVRLALIHDLAESVLTDLPKRSATLLGTEAKYAAEAAALEEILAELPLASKYRALWNEYEAASSPEALLVKDADKLEMVYQALRYGQRGHRNLADFWQGYHWNYPLSSEIFAVLERHRD